MRASGYAIAYVAVTIAGVLQTVGAPEGVISGERLAIVVALAIGYVGVGVGMPVAIGAQLVVGVAATAVSEGYATMMLLAVVSSGVIYLRPRASAVVCVVCAGVAMVAYGARASLGGAVVQAEVQFGAGIAFVIVFGRLVRKERRGREEIERLAGEAAELAVERERNRIAREIHDGLGHYLTIAHVQMEAAKVAIGDPVRAGAAIETAQRLVRDGLTDLRRSVSVLRGAVPGERLVDALHGLAKDAAARVKVEGTPRRLADAVELVIFRAAQEALTNARRHAKATRVEVTLVFAEEIVLRVGDDGVGADGVRSGNGLEGLRERAALVGGSVSIRTAPGDGFVIEMAVPG